MAIHREAEAAHFDEHADEAVIARLFDEAFDVTYGAEDTGGLSYWLASPTIVKGLKKSPSRPDPTQLLVGREPRHAIQELYFDDLAQIVLENWQLFAVLFEDKTRFRMNMATANRARRVDAHAKPVSAEEHEEFLNSFHWLLGRLRKVPD